MLTPVKGLKSARGDFFNRLLALLPREPYELAIWKKVRVNID